MAAASRGSSRHARPAVRALGRTPVAAILATVSHVLAAIPDVLAGIADVFAAVTDVLARVAAVFDSVAAATIVARVPHVLASVTDIFSAITHVLPSIADVLSSVTDVLAPIAHVLAAVADDEWQRTNVTGLTLGLRNGRSTNQQGRGNCGQSEFPHRILQSLVSRARLHGARWRCDAGDMVGVKRPICPGP